MKGRPYEEPDGRLAQPGRQLADLGHSRCQVRLAHADDPLQHHEHGQPSQPLPITPLPVVQLYESAAVVAARLFAVDRPAAVWATVRIELYRRRSRMMRRRKRWGGRRLPIRLDCGCRCLRGRWRRKGIRLLAEIAPTKPIRQLSVTAVQCSVVCCRGPVIVVRCGIVSRRGSRRRLFRELAAAGQKAQANLGGGVVGVDCQHVFQADPLFLRSSTTPLSHNQAGSFRSSCSITRSNSSRACSLCPARAAVIPSRSICLRSLSSMDCT